MRSEIHWGWNFYALNYKWGLPPSRDLNPLWDARVNYLLFYVGAFALQNSYKGCERTGVFLEKKSSADWMEKEPGTFVHFRNVFVLTIQPYTYIKKFVSVHACHNSFNLFILIHCERGGESMTPLWRCERSFRALLMNFAPSITQVETVSENKNPQKCTCVAIMVVCRLLLMRTENWQNQEYFPLLSSI